MSAVSPTSEDTPPTSLDGAGPNNDHYRVVRKRNRVPLSCGPCRTRKLKCDRASPCQNCEKRDDRASCSYAEPLPRKKTGSRSQPSGTPNDMQQRIQKLEGLVLSLMSSGNDAIPPAVARTMSASTRSDSQTPYTPQGSDVVQQDNEMESETEEVTKRFGVLHFNNNQSAYLGDSHWATILHEISEVKSYFADHQKDYQEALNTVETSRKQAGIQPSGPAFLLSSAPKPDLKELHNRLPNRKEVDQLVDKYFSDFDPGLCILHRIAWRRRYEEFWQESNPSDAAFLGQLFAVCGMAMQFYYKSQDEPYEYKNRSQGLATMYRGLTQQCLHLADYSKISQTTIETLIFHLYAEYQKLGEADIGLWCLLRTTISLAMRTGLHKDAKNFPGITAFQCEMRRRKWAFLRMLDTIWSFTVGLPSMIKESDTDNELPANLKDEDFDADTELLPPSRSRNELTDASYLIAKGEISILFGKIVSAVTGLNTVPYEEVIRLNDELRNLYHGTFPEFHVSTSEDFLRTGSSRLSLLRLNLATLYNKAICVLHRRYLTLARKNTKYNPSRQVCVDAALTLLRIQQIVDKKSRAGDRAFRLQSSTSTIMTHDFILAATMIALDLLGTVQMEAAGQESGDIEVWGADRKEEQMQAMIVTRDIFGSHRGHFVEAYKTYSIANVMINMVQQYQQQIDARQAVQRAAAKEFNALAQRNMATDVQPPPVSFMQPAIGLAPDFLANPVPMPDTFSFFDSTSGDISSTMDWNAWDNFIQDPNIDPTNGWSENFQFPTGPTFVANDELNAATANGILYPSPPKS